MSRDITKDIYGDLNYAPITLFGNKLNVGIIGAGRGALIKIRNFYNKGSNIEVLALEFLDDFYELDTNRVKLIKGCYKTQFIKNKHIIIIAVSESELINKIKLDCENHHKIYINSAKFKEGMGVIPVSRESKYISAAINTKVGNPRGAVLVANLITEYIFELDEFIKLSGEIRNNLKFEEKTKDSLLKFINSKDFKFFYDKNKIINVLKLFYDDNIVNKISSLRKEE